VISFTGPPTYGSGHNALVHFVPANREPDCTSAAATPKRLWPPNQHLWLVTAGGVTDPDGDAVTVEVTAVTHNEPAGNRGRGKAAPDWVAAPRADQVWLRAERSGSGGGRVYTLALKATDAHGATCTGTAVVTVPHSRMAPG
jgi:hypothetical protein